MIRFTNNALGFAQWTRTKKIEEVHIDTYYIQYLSSLSVRQPQQLFRPTLGESCSQAFRVVQGKGTLTGWCRECGGWNHASWQNSAVDSPASSGSSTIQKNQDRPLGLERSLWSFHVFSFVFLTLGFAILWYIISFIYPPTSRHVLQIWSKLQSWSKIARSNIRNLESKIQTTGLGFWARQPEIRPCLTTRRFGARCSVFFRKGADFKKSQFRRFCRKLAPIWRGDPRLLSGFETASNWSIYVSFSTATISAHRSLSDQCSLLDLNRDHLRPVFAAGPQPVCLFVRSFVRLLLLVVGCWLLVVVCCLLFVVCCLLVIVCCLLFVGWSLVVVVCCCLLPSSSSHFFSPYRPYSSNHTNCASNPPFAPPPPALSFHVSFIF